MLVAIEDVSDIIIYCALITFILSILDFSGNMFIIFVRVLQLIVYLKLLKYDFPPNVIAFMRYTIKFATFDYFESLNLFERFSDPNYELPENNKILRRISVIGMGSYNSLINLNTIALFALFVNIRVIISLILKLINYFTKSKSVTYCVSILLGNIFMN